MRQFFLFKLVLFLSALIPVFAQEKTVITAYSYHMKPPLVINKDNKIGLYFDFIQYLNEHSAKYHFQLVFVPRKRIELMLENSVLEGMVIGVNPTWFKDKQELKYLWTARIFTDRDEIVSMNSSPISYISAESLSGKVFGGVRGFYYFGINEAIASGKIQRIDTADEISLFSMLLHNRVDAAVISRSTFDYMIKQNKWHSQFHLSKKPHDIFDRRVLIPKPFNDLFNHVSAIVEDMAFDEQWHIILSQYR